MSLIKTYKEFGNAHLYDLRNVVNISFFKTDFNKLEGRNRKFEIVFKNNINNNREAIMQSKTLNYVMIDRVSKILNLLCETGENNGNVENEKNAYITTLEFERIFCTESRCETPKWIKRKNNIENDLENNLDYFGIFCIERENIRGGSNMLKNNKNDIMSLEIDPGYMIIYNNNNIIEYADTPILPFFSNSGYNYGYKDIISLTRRQCTQ
jgi:hypothetical protein